MHRVGVCRSQNAAHDCDRVLEHLKRLALFLDRGFSAQCRTSEILAQRQYDDRRPLARFVIRQYESLWPDHPFQFFVPVQKRDVDYSYFGDAVTLVDAPDAAISATMLTLLKAATTSPNDIVYFANDDKYPIHIDSERASAATELVRGALDDETFGGLHLGCFRGSHFTKDQCKVLRNATDPLLLVKCDGYCKCFFCHHFSRAWVFDAF